jgi:hypothetical protein
VAVGIAAGPAFAQPGPPSEAGVQPVEVAGNPPLVCPAGQYALRVNPVDATHNVTVPNDGSGTLTVDVTDTAAGQVFSFSVVGDIAVRRVTAKGGPNANVYNYVAPAYPNGIAADSGLHAPLGAGPNDSLYFDLSYIDFCFIPSPYNYNGTGTGVATA